MVVDLAEVDDDLVGDMTEIPTRWLYDERAAQNGQRALVAAVGDVEAA